MKKLLLASSVAAVAVAFMSETCETVFVKGADGSPLRVNKSDYDANPEAFELIDGPDHGPQTVAAVNVTGNEQPLPIAPGAPDGATATGQPVVTPNPIATATPATATVNPDDPKAKRLVSKEGKKFFVVDGTGAKVEGNGINAAGYSSEADAWGAVTALLTANAPAA